MIKRLILITLLGVLPTFASASDKRPDFTGRYELAGHFPGRVFKLSLSQHGSRVHAVFYAADSSEPGMKPTGEGDGRVTDEGVLELKFKDNVSNKGTATLTREKSLFHLEMRMIDIVDIKPLHFYGTATMKKVDDGPPTDISTR